MTGKIKLVHSGGNAVSIAVPTSNPSASEVEFKLPQSDGSSGQALVTDASGNLSFSGTGKILQVVSVTKSDTFSLTSTTAFTDVTGLSVAITPASTSNKILVAYDLGWGSSNGHISCRIMRDSTAIKIGDAGGNRTRVTGHYHHSANGQNQYDITQIAGTFLDSPNTTSSVTYKWQVGTPFSSGYTVFVNRTGDDDNDLAYNGRSASSITVMEVAA